MSKLSNICQDGKQLVITLQGPEGCGKTVMAHEIANLLVEAGFDVYVNDDNFDENAEGGLYCVMKVSKAKGTSVFDNGPYPPDPCDGH